MRSRAGTFRRIGGVVALLCVAFGARTALTQNALTSVGQPSKQGGGISGLVPDAPPSKLPDSVPTSLPASLPPPWQPTVPALPPMGIPQPDVPAPVTPGSLTTGIIPPGLTPPIAPILPPNVLPIPPVPPVAPLPPPMPMPKPSTPSVAPAPAPKIKPMPKPAAPVVPMPKPAAPVIPIVPGNGQKPPAAAPGNFLHSFTAPQAPVTPATPAPPLATLPPIPPSDVPPAPPAPPVPSDANPPVPTLPDMSTPLEKLHEVVGPTSSGPGADGAPLHDYYRHGLRFESADKAFSLFVGGRFQFDVVDYLTTTSIRRNIPGTTPLEDGVSFRRIRFDMGGTIYRNFEYYAQVDFANGFLSVPNSTNVTNATYPTDMWVQYKDLPYIGATVRVGNQKPLYSFEHLTSSRFLNFMERSLGFDAFAENQNNGFQPGVTIQNTYADKRGTWGAGVFKYTRSPFGWNVGRNETEVNGRVTYLPVYEDGGRYLVHVGLGAASRDLDQDQARFRARLDARNSPSTFSALVADTNNFFGVGQQLLIPEFVFVAGPLSFQSEYYASWVGHARLVGPNNTPLADQGTVYMQSVYGEVHYFLTGEHREYSRETGVFTRVVPRNSVAWNHGGFTGCGAWQVTARYSYLDLNSKGIRGGEVHDMTLGLNWFLNPNMKMQWNYFLAGRNAVGTAGDGLIHGFAMRTAIDF
jgi:phosphate-selective porin OprO/OprP